MCDTGPGTLEVLSKHLLIERARLWMVVNLGKKMTFPGFCKSEDQGSRKSLALFEVKNKCPDFKNSLIVKAFNW